MATINMLEETANYLLNHCFLLGSVEDQRAKYLYVQDHLDEVRAVFAPLGYSVLLYPAPLQAAALVNGSQARLLKYESILLLVLRLLYLQKRESLAANADEVLVTVEEVQTELQKMNLPRRLDQKTLENLMRTLRRYNLARPVGRLSGLDSRIEVFPTVLLALPDSDLADAAAEAEQKANVLLAGSEKVGADIKARAASTAEFTRRRTVLAAKQNAIRDVIAAAQKELHDLPDDEYFSVLLKLAQKNALPGDAEMQLNEKDLARMPQDFLAQLKMAVPGTNITVSNTPCNIPDGFLLVYGGIDVNCTFASLFEAAGDTLQDLAGGMLFR